MSVSRIVRPQQRGPDRPGVRWELVALVWLWVSMWGLLITAAGTSVGWWSAPAWMAALP